MERFSVRVGDCVEDTTVLFRIAVVLSEDAFVSQSFELKMLPCEVLITYLCASYVLSPC